MANLTVSKSDARRAIEQGGITVNEKKVPDVNAVIGKAYIEDGRIMLQKGKKSFCKINVLN